MTPFEEFNQKKRSPEAKNERNQELWREVLVGTSLANKSIIANSVKV
jgi:hypothetical protein